MIINRLRGTVADRPIDASVAQSQGAHPTEVGPPRSSLLERITDSLSAKPAQKFSLGDIPGYDKG